MNKRLHEAQYVRNEASKAMHKASEALTAAINAEGYGSSWYREAVEQARDAYSDAVMSYDMAQDELHEAMQAPVHEVRCHSGWKLAPSFKSYWYDDYVDAALAAIEAAMEIPQLIEDGKVAPSATVTLIRDNGRKYTWDRNGDMIVS